MNRKQIKAKRNERNKDLRHKFSIGWRAAAGASSLFSIPNTRTRVYIPLCQLNNSDLDIKI